MSFVSRRTSLKEHKFRIGQSVYFTSRPIGHMIANSTYEVVKLLPSDGADYQYRIKNPKEAFERIIRERGRQPRFKVYFVEDDNQEPDTY